MTIMDDSLEEIRSGQAEVTTVQAGSEQFAMLSSKTHNAQYFIGSNRKKNPRDFTNKLFGCFTGGARKETLKSFA